MNCVTPFVYSAGFDSSTLATGVRLSYIGNRCMILGALTHRRTITLADKSEVVFLEHIPRSGIRRWRRAHLLLDPVGGLINLRFKQGLRKKKTLEWQVGQLESFKVEMQPNPHSSIYERAFIVLLLLLATNLTIRFNLEWMARYTTPIPPRPISSRTSYAPIEECSNGLHPFGLGF